MSSSVKTGVNRQDSSRHFLLLCNGCLALESVGGLSRIKMSKGSEEEPWNE